MKPDLDTSKIIRSTKFLRLARFTGSRASALGMLLLLWEHAKPGDRVEPRPSYETPDDIEAACDWNGPRGDLAGALATFNLISELDSTPPLVLFFEGFEAEEE